MGRVDSFFKAYERDWFWVLAELFDPDFVAQHPDRPRPEPVSTENVQPPAGLKVSDMLLQIGSGDGAVFILIENALKNDDEQIERLIQYMQHFIGIGYRNLLAILLYVNEPEAPRDAKGVEIVRRTKRIGRIQPWTVEYYQVVLGRVLPPIEEAAPALLPLYMVQEPPTGDAQQLERIESLLSTKVVPKLEQVKAEGDRGYLNQVAEYIIWALASRHRRLGKRAMEVLMGTLKLDLKDHPYFLEGREEGREKGREEGREEGLRSSLLRLGRQRFGEPGATTLAAVEAITDKEQLERLLDRVLVANDWQELLGSE